MENRFWAILARSQGDYRGIEAESVSLDFLEKRLSDLIVKRVQFSSKRNFREYSKRLRENLGE